MADDDKTENRFVPRGTPQPPPEDDVIALPNESVPEWRDMQSIVPKAKDSNLPDLQTLAKWYPAGKMAWRELTDREKVALQQQILTMDEEVYRKGPTGPHSTEASRMTPEVENTAPKSDDLADNIVSDQLEKNKPSTTTPSREKQGRTLRTGFIFSLVVGTIVVIATAGVNPFISVVAASTVMFLYLIFSWRLIKRSETAKELFADSFYYLGFLFTFIALIVAIIHIDPNDMNVNHIVSQMGIALITTILGLAVRVTLVHFNPIVSEPEQDLIKNLGTLANELKDQTESYNNHLRSSVEDLSTIRSEMNSLMSSTNQVITESLSGFSETMSNARNEISQFSEKFQSTDFDQINKATPRLGQSINALSEDMDNVRTNMGKITEALAQSANDIQTFSKELEQFEKTKFDFDAVSKTAIELNKSLEQSSESASAANKGIEKRLDSLKDSMSDVEREYKRAQDVAKQLKESFADNATEIVKFLRNQNKN